MNPIESGYQFILITYDIRDDRRREKLAKLLLSYGDRVQYSVYECLVTQAQLETIHCKSGEILAEEDSLRFYPLCRSCRTKIETTDCPPVTEHPACILI